MEERIIEINDLGAKRIIVISDIHGYLQLLKNLLDKVKLKEDDYLIILGDFINKGPQSLQTLRYIQKLNERKRTYVISGNHEYATWHNLMGENMNDRLLKFAKSDKKNIIQDWFEELDMDLSKISSGKELKQILIKNFKSQLDYIHDLYYGIELNGHIFVHAGIDETKIDWKDSSIEILLASKEFYKKKHRFNQMVVVGHWPTQNTRDLSIANDIHFFLDKKIICIDGGTMKSNKQLNALIIEKSKMQYNYKQMDVDPYQYVDVIEECIPLDLRLVKFSWQLNQLEILKKEDDLSLCKNIQTKQIGYVFNDLINNDSTFSPHVVDYVSRFFKISNGEKVKYILSVGAYALVKFKDEFGWVSKKNIKLSKQTQ